MTIKECSTAVLSYLEEEKIIVKPVVERPRVIE